MSAEQKVLSGSQHLIVESRSFETEITLLDVPAKSIAQEIHLHRHGDEATRLCKDTSKPGQRLVRCLFTHAEDSCTQHKALENYMKDPCRILHEIERGEERDWLPATPEEVLRVYHSLNSGMRELLFEGRHIAGFQRKTEDDRTLWLNGWMSHHLHKVNGQPITELSTTVWIDHPVMPMGHKSLLLLIKDV